MKIRSIRALVAAVVNLAGCAVMGQDVLYDDFSWRSTILDRTKWWRGGVDSVDGTNVVLNESDLTSSMMFLEGDFTFVMGAPSASSQGLLGLGDIDNGDPFLILSDKGAGWRFHVRNGPRTYTGPVIASSLAKGDVVAFHWDSNGATVSINGTVKDAQTTVHPPRMPLTVLEWTGSATVPDKAGGRIVLASVGYSALAKSPTKPATKTLVPSTQTAVLSAGLVEDTFVDSSNPNANFNGRTNQICIRNSNHHPDLTGAGATIDIGLLGLVQFSLPQLPSGWNVSAARLAGVVAQNHRKYGMPGWAPGRPIEMEVLGLDANPDLATVTYNDLHDAAGRGVISDYTASGSVNFTFGRGVTSLEVLSVNTSTTPPGRLLQFPDSAGGLCAFVRSKISRAGPKIVTLAIGPGRTQAVSGMDCDFEFFAKGNAAGQAPMSLTLELNRVPPASTRTSGDIDPPGTDK